MIPTALTPTETLVGQAQHGSDAAFGELVERYSARLASWLRPRFGDGLRSNLSLDDVLQETFLRAYRSIGRFQWDGEAAFEGWLRTIGKHVVFKLATPRGRPTGLLLEREVMADTPSPSKVLRRDERFHRLERALASLSPEHREVIRLARLEGLAIREIAERMGRSPDAVSQLLGRALKKLRARFGHTESLGLPARALCPPGGDREHR